MRQAAAEILAVYHSADFETEHKADDSPLTAADRRSNAVLTAGINALTPDIPILSEENAIVPYEERQHWQRYWCIDPLDGTKEFVARNGEFSINVALIENGSPVLGITMLPVTGDIYYAEKGKGAFKLDTEGQETTLKSASFTLTESNLNILASRSHLNAQTEAFIGLLTRPKVVQKGSALKFTSIADGSAHIYPRFAPTMEWDTAAAQILVEEAGGKVITTLDSQPLRYNKADLRNPDFIAFGKVLQPNGPSC